MDPTTLRLPPDTLAELDSEYSDYGYRSRSDYIRAIIEHRDPPFEGEATTPATTADYDGPTTDDYERLRDRVDELEGRVDELESLNQQSGGESASVLVNDEPAAEESREPPSSAGQPRGSDAQDVVEYVRKNQPVSRSDIVVAFRDEWEQQGIKGDSWWRRHARDKLKDAGAEFVRNVGWEMKE